MKTLVVGVLLALLAALPARAQESNREVFERLGVQCLVDAPDTLSSFRLSAPDSLPYVRAALNRQWVASGRSVTLDPDGVAPVLSYRVDEAGVTYDRLGRGLFAREVSLNLQYTLTNIAGRILDDGICSETAVDTVATRNLGLLEDPAYAETVGARPAPGWLRRYVEPVILIGAAAVGVLLFFSLRSDQSGQ